MCEGRVCRRHLRLNRLLDRLDYVVTVAVVPTSRPPQPENPRPSRSPVAGREGRHQRNDLNRAEDADLDYVLPLGRGIVTTLLLACAVAVATGQLNAAAVSLVAIALGDRVRWWYRSPRALSRPDATPTGPRSLRRRTHQ